MSAFEYPKPMGLKGAAPAPSTAKTGAFARRATMKGKQKAPPMPMGKGKGKKPC